ncbi:MAG TPA: nuclear transport factor 2 family protein [Steroidobacteraceae bacterium]|nr:nuclear transport factor 2 family protein [Steroidobacteraceae bacterium]
MQTRTTVLLAVLAAVAQVPVSLSAEADAARESQDRAAIEGLEWRYVHAIDTLDADAYVQAFTPDGQLGTGPRAAKGAGALRGIVAFMKQDAAERNKGRALPIELYHIMTNLYIEFVDQDHARVHYYWMALYTTPRATEQQGGHERPPDNVEKQPRVAEAGRGLDQVVRINGRWLIRLRDVWSRD